ncbi:MAG: SRPBCC domain-containing protein [Planctomycetota bacterium]
MSFQAATTLTLAALGAAATSRVGSERDSRAVEEILGSRRKADLGRQRANRHNPRRISTAAMSYERLPRLRSSRLVRSLAAAAILATSVAAQSQEAETEPPPPNVAKITVDAGRAEVWQAWTTSEGLMSFLSPQARVELRAGGPFEVWFDPTAEAGLRGSEGCEVLAFLENEMLSFSWNAPPSLGHLRARRHFVVVRLRDVDDGRRTEVEVIDGGYSADEGDQKIRDYFAKAWPFVLSNLAKRFESGPLWPEQTKPIPAPPTQLWLGCILPSRPEILTSPTDEEREILSQHPEYIRTLADRARVLVVGPCPQPGFGPRGEHAKELKLPSPLGILVLRAGSAEEARSLLENDPAVAAGIFAARVMPIATFFVE